MRARIATAVVGLLVLTGCDAMDEMTSVDRAADQIQRSHVADAAPVRTFEIIVKNMTEEGQPFTPPLIALHRRAEDLFTVGKAASPELQQIAENGNLGPMLARLGASHHVSSSAVGATPPVPPLQPGESVTLTLDAEPGSRFVSVVSMLICTNDGFTGVDGAHLPNRVGDVWEGYADAYDAGTEVNTEDFADLVPPCPGLTGVPSSDPGTGTSDPALAEGGVVHHHPGIVGDDDLDAELHGWENPVAKVTVKRVS
ncbi:MAG: hypothetical protein GWM92_15465 [Gemmatimonadetes bacterium]|nr:hypothetical protein [Gemmatimonadota bacterium]NIR80143.1 hypothetical protein [Gemmatimonadota bacterium]NIT88895.1 hypothetical protein [Gemmatimonadota bacterium]NIU32698.1 hypothetical protein [Gemmatimonadota bacterium]NIU37137.1 hypothetical protein [Gemmatimonadota bacterium]